MLRHSQKMLMLFHRWNYHSSKGTKNSLHLMRDNLKGQEVAAESPHQSQNIEGIKFYS